ncbi:MAG: O-antigen ligase protein [Microbacteriaceae bacterium]|jgi:exopolysaccharide production protein ExoQ|nr:O-antigen ligase protein [Microbacteriaceae bacterium]
MRALERGGFRFGMLTLTLFTVLAGDAWRYSITWFGFGAITLGVAAFSVALLVRGRSRWSIGGLPYPLLVFLALTTASIFWSAYPSATAVGLVANWITVTAAVAFAVSFDWATIIRSLGLALRIILGLSIVFELFVSVVLRQPLLPLWYSYPEGPLAKSLYWSRDLLLDGGKIQGIVGNSALLGFVALLGLIVFGAQLAQRRKRLDWVWLAVAAFCIYSTRSATITVALLAVLVVTGAVLAFRLAQSGRVRVLLYGVVAVVSASLIFVGVAFRSELLALMGKGDTLTGRTDIWNSVIDLAVQRPVFGWGWVSYWAPWVEPFDGLAFEGGVNQYQAHNAWLDLWLQVGIVGAVVFGALVVSTIVRSWFFATDRPQFAPTRVGAFTAESLVPILILTALTVQSLVESRLIIEYGLVLLVIFAVKTKRGEAS